VLQVHASVANKAKLANSSNKMLAATRTTILHSPRHSAVTPSSKRTTMIYSLISSSNNRKEEQDEEDDEAPEGDNGTARAAKAGASVKGAKGAIVHVRRASSQQSMRNTVPLQQFFLSTVLLHIERYAKCIFNY
jgi:hypothetical protein